MRKILILYLIASVLSGPGFSQRMVRVNFTQPDVLTASAGHDTIVCNSHPIILGGSPTATGGTNSYLYMWSPPDGLSDPTSANPVATLSESKSYMLSVTDEQGCQAVSFVSIFVDPCLGIDNSELDPEITIYPNPTHGTFTIHGIRITGHRLLKIEIFNQLGQIVFSKDQTQLELSEDIEVDTNIKESGIYYLRISLSDQLISQRLIVR